MTSRLLMPYRRNGDGVTADAHEPVLGSTRPTATLDWEHPAVGALVERIPRSGDARESLRVAHGIIAREVRPVYSVDDLRRASRTLKLGRGSCSQRMAVLEAVARAVGVPTRVRGLLVDGRFWYPRFPGSSRSYRSKYCSPGPSSCWKDNRTGNRTGDGTANGFRSPSCSGL